jgi:hypothetical protein
VRRLPLPSAAIALAALALLIGAGAPRAASGQQDKAAVSISGPSRIGTSASARLSIDVKGARNLAGFQFVLSFDSRLLQAESVDKTGFLAGSGREIVCKDPTIEAGAVQLTCVTLGLQPPGVDGDGAIAVVTLKATGHGSTPLALSRVKLVHPDGSELPSTSSDGRLTVGGSGAAFPWWAGVLIGIAAVAAAAGGALLWRRRRAAAMPADAADWS